MSVLISEQIGPFLLKVSQNFSIYFLEIFIDEESIYKRSAGNISGLDLSTFEDLLKRCADTSLKNLRLIEITKTMPRIEYMIYCARLNAEMKKKRWAKSLPFDQLPLHLNSPYLSVQREVRKRLAK